jgi:hypothetical protein
MKPSTSSRAAASRSSLESAAGKRARPRAISARGPAAASINHPNSVYIFGSEDISGTPVIAMVLLRGGTLNDRVKARGPLPPADAVDAILQVIAGPPGDTLEIGPARAEFGYS